MYYMLMKRSCSYHARLKPKTLLDDNGYVFNDYDDLRSIFVNIKFYWYLVWTLDQLQ